MDMEKLAGVAHFGEEELARARRIIETRLDGQDTLDALFDCPKTFRDDDRKLIKELFVQHECAEKMSPVLVKRACKNVDAFFEQNAEKIASVTSALTVAQQRYPELTGIRK